MRGLSAHRWTIAATIPIFLVLLVAHRPGVRLFGYDFTVARTRLSFCWPGSSSTFSRQRRLGLDNGRPNGWDLAVYAGSLALNLGLAFWLCPEYGMEGAAHRQRDYVCRLENGARLVLVNGVWASSRTDRDYMRLLPTRLSPSRHVVIHSPWSGVAC